MVNRAKDVQILLQELVNILLVSIVVEVTKDLKMG